MQCPQIQLKCTRQSTSYVKNPLSHRRFRSCLTEYWRLVLSKDHVCNWMYVTMDVTLNRSSNTTAVYYGLYSKDLLFWFKLELFSFPSSLFICWFVESCKNWFLLLEIMRENWSNFSFAFTINVFETFKVHVLPQKNVWP